MEQGTILVTLAMLAVCASGCGGDDGGTSAPPADSGTDSVVTDTAPVDTGTTPTDTAVSDSGAPDTGAIDTGTAPVDTGVVDTGVVDSGAADTGDVGTGCTSGTFYTTGMTGLMEPGKNCATCHTTSLTTTKLLIAGTVYTGLKEPDRCQGVASGEVWITSTGGAVTKLPINAAGNFYLKAGDGTLTFPVNAKVVVGTAERPMLTSIAASTGGDCNGCHTSTGASGASGRVQAP